ncbi:DUF1800 domain-containing protein [Siansivirga zeaxanthinifaciens]|uniref:Uncharacterized protein n=1 Tax=Siansivirga zeaxanthinifaciens CC-SAMT-1 TaxID=1454006 RepID=A0A0C5WBR8_9FLAO|nr:DUF1800 domain-containing protein [Siansivirga zeaxanthinifaciens]AJR03722.1 hypothetical protein AW14_08860 [Siansivirga zeaxanthinifaciens CC-SAMT-1]
MKINHLQHLYWRAGFGLDVESYKLLKNKSKKEVVDLLFSESSKITPLTIDLSEFEPLMNKGYKGMKDALSKEEFQKFQKQSRKKLVDFNEAWIDRMTTSKAVLNEKMTLFWANIFVCQDNNIWHMQQYNNLLRTHALGHFGNFVKAISKSASMSKYLNNKQNVKEDPNENFARELMELFTLGIGNYSEKDIKEAARAFTGWSYKPNGSFFLRKFKHDHGAKTFLGKTGYFDGDAIIDIILEQKQCAKYICSRIYMHFVNPIINDTQLDEITEVFYKDYNIGNLMKYIFNSDWFYNDAHIGVKIKSPIELLVGIKKVVPVTFINKRQLIYLQKIMGQVLLYPPNVAGWKEDKNWIDSNTLMLRLKLASILLNDAVINVDEKGDYEDEFEAYYKKQINKNRFIKTEKKWEVFQIKFEDYSFEELKRLLINSQIDKDTQAFLAGLVLSDKKDYCIQLMSIPEYQMC